MPCQTIRKERIVTIKGSCHCGNTQFEVTEAPAPLHLFAMLEAWRAVGLLQARTISPDVAA